MEQKYIIIPIFAATYSYLNYSDYDDGLVKILASKNSSIYLGPGVTIKSSLDIANVNLIPEFDIEYMYQVIKNKSIINAYNYLLSNNSTFMINNGPYLFKVKLGISTDIEDYKFGFGYEYLLHKKSYWHNISLNCGLSL